MKRKTIMQKGISWVKCSEYNRDANDEHDLNIRKMNVSKTERDVYDEKERIMLDLSW